MLPKRLLHGYLCLLVCCFFSLYSNAQGNRITGKVTDADGKPVDHVSVVIKGTTIGTTTTADGNFNLNASTATGNVLVFSAVGFVTKEVTQTDASAINVQLERSANSMDAVVVVGYGTQKKKDVTGSVVSVGKDRMENMPNTNFQQILQGALPGISVTQSSSSAEGNGTSIIIRGKKSITAGNQPMIILDGIPYNGYLSDITPSNIESIDVLKDASAAAIYGSRAANGVILITTKKGTAGKTTFNYDASYGIQEVAHYLPVLSPEEFYAYKNTREPGKMTLSEQAVYDSKKFTDWIGLGTQKGSRLQQNISARGGSQNVRYFASLNYINSQGVSVGDKFKRLSTRINLDANLTKWLTYTTNTELAWSDRSGGSTTFGGDDGIALFNPLTRAFDSSGKQLLYSWPEDVHFGNPLAPLLSKSQDNSYKLSTNNSFTIKFPFVAGLSYKLNTGVDYRNRIINTYYGRDTKKGLGDLGNFSGSTNSVRNYTVDNIMNYDRSFGKHSIGVTGLYSYEYNDVETTGITATGFPDDSKTFYQANAASLVKPSASYSRRTQISQMGRVNYSYDSRYLLTLTFRRDGASVFGEDEKFANFPAIALGWNVTSEKFMKNAEWLDNLKLRLSYGKNGNQGIGEYSSLATIATRSYVDGSALAAGYIPSRLAAPGLKWETTNSANIGIDFSVLNHRISGSIDAYSSKTYDLLLSRSIPPQNGTDKIIANIGKTANKGLEVNLTSINVRKNDFRWTTNLNYSFNRNKIVELYGNGINDTLNTWFIGHPIDVNFRYVYVGVWQLNDADTAKYGTHPGWAKVKDLNNNGKVETSDKTIIGSIEPKFIWGMGNTFQFKNLSLYVFVHGVQGTNVPNTYMSDNNVQAGVRFNTMRKNWWTPTNPTNEYYGNIVGANPQSAPIIQNSSFVRIKDILFSYDFSKALLDKHKLNKLKIFIEARNMFTITKWGGLDPELDAQDGVPLQREYSVGLNLGF